MSTLASGIVPVGAAEARGSFFGYPKITVTLFLTAFGIVTIAKKGEQRLGI
jgi:hypothetical protein